MAAAHTPTRTSQPATVRSRRAAKSSCDPTMQRYRGRDGSGWRDVRWPLLTPTHGLARASNERGTLARVQAVIPPVLFAFIASLFVIPDAAALVADARDVRFLWHRLGRSGLREFIIHRADSSCWRHCISARAWLGPSPVARSPSVSLTIERLTTARTYIDRRGPRKGGEKC